MPGANRYDQLVAWQVCMELSDAVAEIVKGGPVSRNFRLRDQLRDSAQAAPALIAEGFLRFTPEEFVRYLRMARGELGEVQTHLEIARRQGCLTEEQLSRVIPLSRRAMGITTRLLQSKLPLLKTRRR